MTRQDALDHSRASVPGALHSARLYRESGRGEIGKVRVAHWKGKAVWSAENEQRLCGGIVYMNDEGSHGNKAFGAQSHGFGTHYLRFVRCLATRDARLVSRCWPLYGTGLATRRILTEGFRWISSSFPKLLGAMSVHFSEDRRDCSCRSPQPLRRQDTLS
jgi:hypothetical protein